MVMQEGHKRFILVWADAALRPVWGSDLVLSYTQGARSRGDKQVAREGRSPKSQLMRWVRAHGSSQSVVFVWSDVCLVGRVSKRCPTSPFIVSRGGRAVHE